MRKLLVLLMVAVLMISPAFAHPGGTDGKGGHWNHSTGEYHYHHGYSAHDHEDGVCPYEFDDKTGENSETGGGLRAVAYAATNKSSDWFPEYTEAQTARRAAEEELERIKFIYLRNFAFSAVVGLCSGLAILIVQIRRSQKRLAEAEQHFLEQKHELLKKLEDEHRRADEVIVAAEKEKQLFVADLEREKREDQIRRLETNSAFAQLARNAKDPVQSSVYAEHVLKNTPALKPDSKLVYVPRDLSGKLYHREYIPCGIRNMVLASRDNVEAYGLKQCPECEQCALPVADLIVCAAPSGTHVYHAVRSLCSGYSAQEIPLSRALARGLRPCSKCYPPKELPKVFF